MKKLSAIVIGYGNRGATYCKYAEENPDKLEIVAVAEPHDEKRELAKKRLNIKDENAFNNWCDFVNQEKMADFAILATQDELHCEPALMLIDKGYNLLIEKPMATTPEECKKITEAAEKKNVKVIVCHVLRFTKFWCKIKEIIDDGELGEIMSIVHLENVGHHHQSHSYVRGNWRRSDESSPMILAKSCHDTDIIQWLIGKECKKVQSFGSLSYFTEKNKPEGAPMYCADGCPHRETCFYDAESYYNGVSPQAFRQIITNKPEPTDKEVTEVLKKGPYGRCVFNCDNDVVDHQVVNMEFDGGCTVSFTMNAFNEGGRFIKIFGTKGELTGIMENSVIEVYPFATRERRIYECEIFGEHIDSGHGGGDTGIMIDAIKYFDDENPSSSICSIRTSYISHLIAFAAEKSRITGEVVDIEEFSDNL